MVYEVYENIKTDEEILIEDAQEYAMDNLGIKITPLGKVGEYTLDQIDFIKEFTEWYFSGNWVRKKKKDTQYENTYEDIISDEIYEDNLERKLMNAEFQCESKREEKQIKFLEEKEKKNE